MSKSSNKCPATLVQKVAVTGAVTITPKIECGPLTVTCLEGRIVKGAPSGSEHKGQTSCRVLLVQELCVEVPVFFRADAKCEVDEVHCGPAIAMGHDPSEDGSDSGGESGSHSGHSDDSGSSGGHDDRSGSGDGHDDGSGSDCACGDESGGHDDQSGSGGCDDDGSGSGHSGPLHKRVR